jgi:hypothetical protein
MGVDVTRRDAILAAASAALAAGVPAAVWAQAQVSAAEFLALSQRLTGASGLDQGVAETYLGAFLAAGQGPALRELAGAAGEPTTPLADAIVAAWYSGLYDKDGGQAVGDFGGALVWDALAFTKPFAECGGVTGYWAGPPEG